ncbi:MAG: OsmC family protein [Thermaerobacter sp.]|nr:OsmC family protein [Thermaerobacter sp.]
MLTGSVTWTEGMAVLGQSGSGHELVMDGAPSVGGEDRGPRPKELTLLSLGGCTALDVISIMRKMQVPFKSFRIELEGDTAETHPSVFTEIRLIYRTEGEGVQREKVDRAIQLSQERYCGVTHMLNKTAKIVVISDVNGDRKEI